MVVRIPKGTIIKIVSTGNVLQAKYKRSICTVKSDYGSQCLVGFSEPNEDIENIEFSGDVQLANGNYVWMDDIKIKIIE